MCKTAMIMDQPEVAKNLAFLERPCSKVCKELAAGCTPGWKPNWTLCNINAAVIRRCYGWVFSVSSMFWRHSGPIHTGRGTRCATWCKQMGPVDVNGGVHTARKQYQRKNIWICAHVASRILCGLGLRKSKKWGVVGRCQMHGAGSDGCLWAIVLFVDCRFARNSKVEDKPVFAQVWVYQCNHSQSTCMGVYFLNFRLSH